MPYSFPPPPVAAASSLHEAAALIAVCLQRDTVTHVSSNLARFLGPDASPDRLLGNSIRTLLNRDTLHKIRNAFAASGTDATPRFAAMLSGLQGPLDIYALSQKDYMILHLIPETYPVPCSATGLRDLTDFVELLCACPTVPNLLETALRFIQVSGGYAQTTFLRHPDHGFKRQLSGYAPLPKVWRTKGPPLRIIPDTQSRPIPIHTADTNLPGLDLSQMHLRSPSATEIHVLAKRRVHAALVLPVFGASSLIGAVVAWHPKPRMVPARLRHEAPAMMTVLGAQISSFHGA